MYVFKYKNFQVSTFIYVCLYDEPSKYAYINIISFEFSSIF